MTLTDSHIIMEGDMLRFIKKHNLRLSREGSEGLLRRFDYDHDGKVAFTDFVTLLTQSVRF